MTHYSQKKYQSLTIPTISLVEFFKKSPLVRSHLNLARDKSLNRDIDFNRE